MNSEPTDYQALLAIKLYRASIIARNNAELLQTYSNATANGMELTKGDIDMINTGRELQYHYTNLTEEELSNV